MTPHRKQTSPTGSQPVRFYKFIAITFLLITVVLFGLIIFMSSKRATITVTAKSEPVNIAKTVEVGGDLSGLHGNVASTEVSLTKTFKPTGTQEETGVAGGVITVHNDSSADQALIATTRFLAADGKTLFRLQNKVVAPAKGKIDAEVYADQPGRASEIGPSKFSIPGLNEAKQKLIYGDSSQPMKGGVKTIGVLSADDVKKAEKAIQADLQKKGEEDLTALFPNLVGIYGLKDVKIETKAEVGSTIEGFEMSAQATVVGVFYDQKDLVSLITKELDKRVVSEAEIISLGTQAPTASLVDYDLEKGTAKVEVNGSGLATLNPESKQLQKVIFYGKTKEEIRRYLLSIDHINGVDINFNPSWMHTVPHVAEHVSVVVKNVQ